MNTLPEEIVEIIFRYAHQNAMQKTFQFINKMNYVIDSDYHRFYLGRLAYAYSTCHKCNEVYSYAFLVDATRSPSYTASKKLLCSHVSNIYIWDSNGIYNWGPQPADKRYPNYFHRVKKY